MAAVQDDLKSLKAKRTAFKGQITRLRKGIEEYRETGSIIRLKTKVNRIEKIFDEYANCQRGLDVLENPETDIADRDAIEDTYLGVLSEALELITQAEAPSQRGTNHGSETESRQNQSPVIVQPEPELHLPAIKLPSFGGKFEDWPGFADQFTATVHDNRKLNDGQRLTYLRSCLVGEAAEVIASLSNLSSNYSIAWEILTERFDQPSIIVEQHLKALFDLPKLHKVSYSEISQFLNSAEAHTKALNSINQPTRDTLLIYLLASKLDTLTYTKWKESADSQSFPSLEHFFGFLHTRRRLAISTTIETRPTGARAQETATYRQPRTVFREKPRPYPAMTAVAQIACAICKNGHFTYVCRKLLSATPSDRERIVKHARLCLNCLRSGHVVAQCHASTCRKCEGKHHTLLHKEAIAPTQPTQSNITSLPSSGKGNAVLATAVIQMIDAFGKPHLCRALIDNGSQSHFVSRVMAEKLQIAPNQVNIPVVGIANVAKTITQAANILVKSRRTDFTTVLNCLILDSLHQTVPSKFLDRRALKIPISVKLADPHFHVPGPIDAIIGVPVYHKLLAIGKISLLDDSIALLKTNFGWIVTGEMPTNPVQTTTTICNFAGPRIDVAITRFWEIEEIPAKPHMSEENRACEKHFRTFTRRDSDTGKYTVRLPFKESAASLGDSYGTALKRLFTLEKSLARHKERAVAYRTFIREYQELGHMSELSASKTNDGFYLPHFAVTKESSATTKLRVVFNGSARTSSGISLNDTLMIGPSIQDDLFTLVLRFRSYVYVLTADIAKMYRQIWVHPEDRKFQKILWRDDATQPVRTYALNTVTYGTSAAPYLAIRTLHQLADDERDSFPIAAKILKRDFYVDDMLTGAQTYAEAQMIRDQIQELTRRGGLELRQWASNCPQLLAPFGTCSVNAAINLDATDGRTVLGLQWNPTEDSITYAIKSLNSPRVTKRTILSDIARLFDPLGLLGPVIVRAKILMQRLWQAGTSWDETVPTDIYSAWIAYQSELPALEQIRLPRQIIASPQARLQIHGFSDASERAYGACLYLRSTDENGVSTTRLLCSKSRVAPLKTNTLPRLELCAALLLTRLYRSVAQALSHLKVTNVWLWSDSTITLAWIGTPPHTLKTFVSNRVAEIQESSCKQQWRHVSSQDNPADLISRGRTPNELRQATLWFEGPAWLQMPENNWPETVTRLDTIPEQRPIVACVSIPHTCEMLQRYSTFSKLKRTIAYCLRFAGNCSASHKGTSRTTGPLTVNELDGATNTILRIVQSEGFAEDIHAIKANKQTTSRLSPLKPFLDPHGILRVGGRISRARIPYTQRHPAVLPQRHHVTALIVRAAHATHYHAGCQATLSAVRESYWPVNGRATVKAILRKCVTCQRANPRGSNYPMAELPTNRVTPSRPFARVGIDYCGPIYIKEKRLRNRNKVKVYIAIFICLATKAVHIEIVSDLSTDAFLAALRRFFSRRGKATDIYSDNATTFVGANRELTELHKLIQTPTSRETICQQLANDGITWHFIPPRSPHFGGLWEAAVRSFKKHYTRVIGETLLTYEDLHTYTTEIEAILNSRPLTPLSTDPTDLNPLTPAHFLIGGPLMAVPEPDFTQLKPSRMSMWQHLQQLKQHFWNRWRHEYLHELTVRKNWHTHRPTNIDVGTLVILREPSTQPAHWTMGRIVEVHPGEDGITRVVTVRTSNGNFKRAVKNLSPLDL